MKSEVFGKSVQGASHIRSGTECQDNCKYQTLKKDGTIILAVADGHGSKNCPYSEKGSELATNAFFTVMKRLLRGYEENSEQLLTYLNREGDTRIAMDIDAEWKRAVRKDYEKRGLTISKNENGEEDLNSVYSQYGSTLLGLMITKDFLFGFQLGDGDICYVTDNDLEPVVVPDKILGVETHSLSRPDSWKKAITVVRRMDISENLPAMFSLSSDGYANSYKSEEEFHNTVKDYLGMLKEYGCKAVEKSLPDWLSETSAMGCGDDITMLIAYFPKEEGEEKTMESEDSGNE